MIRVAKDAPLAEVRRRLLEWIVEKRQKETKIVKPEESAEVTDTNGDVPMENADDEGSSTLSVDRLFPQDSYFLFYSAWSGKMEQSIQPVPVYGDGEEDVVDETNGKACEEDSRVGENQENEQLQTNRDGGDQRYLDDVNEEMQSLREESYGYGSSLAYAPVSVNSDLQRQPKRRRFGERQVDELIVHSANTLAVAVRKRNDIGLRAF